MDMHRTRTLLASGAAVAVVGLTGLAGTASARPCTDADSAECPPPPPTQVVRAHGIVDVAPGQTLGVRGIPKQNARQYRQLRDGARVAIVCQTRGSKVSGTFGTTNLWNKLKRGGYVSDAYVYTGKDGRVAPNC